MADLFSCDPLGRFSGLGSLYAQFRPAYPEAALDYIVSQCNLIPAGVIVDVGCGTGISSRQFAGRGFRVIGVEPNGEMRAQAEAAIEPTRLPSLLYREGQAENTGLPAGIADLVLAAQAFHWFEPGATLLEFHRLLRPGGWVALLWNEHDDKDPFTAAFGELLQAAQEAAQVPTVRGEAAGPLLTSQRFQDQERVVFANEQILDKKGLLGRAFSASYAPREPQAAEDLARALKELFYRFQRDGRVLLHYETAVYLARRL